MANRNETIIVDVQVTDVKKQLGETAKAINDLKEQNKALKKEQKDGTSDWVSSTATIKANEAQIKLLTAAEKSLEGQLRAATSENKNYGKSNVELRAQVADLERQYNALTDAQKNTATGKELLKQQNELKAAVKGNAEELGNFQDSVGNYGKSLVNLGRSLMSLIGLTGGITLLSNALRNAFNVITEFDQKMANVSAITMGTKEEMKKLRDIAIQLGTTTKFSASEVAGLESELGKLGYTTQQIIDATGGVVSAAAATGESLQKTAEIVGSVTMAFGLSAGESQRVADVMAQSFNATALGLDNFSESIKYVAPVAKQVGVSVEETAALLGVLANNGIKGSMAGTALRRIFSELTKDGGTLQEKLELLAKEGLNLSGAQDEVGAHAKTALLVLKDQNELIPKLTKEFENSAGAAETAAGKMMDTISGQSTVLKSTWSGFILSVENGTGSFSINLKKMLSFTADFVRGVQKLLLSNSDNQKMIAKEEAEARLKEFEKRAQNQKDYSRYINEEIIAEKNLNASKLNKISILNKEIEKEKEKSYLMRSDSLINSNKKEVEGLTNSINKSVEYINVLGNLRRAKSETTALELKNQGIVDENKKISTESIVKISEDAEKARIDAINNYVQAELNRINEVATNAENKRQEALKKVQETEDLLKSQNETLRGLATENADIELQAFNDLQFAKRVLADGNISEMARIDREALRAEYDAKIANAQAAGRDTAAIEAAFSEEKKRINQAENDAKLDIASQTMGSLSTIFGEGTKAGKAFAAAQVAIDTYKGALSAFTSMASIPFVGPVLGGIAAAGVVAKGVKSIKDIYAVKKGQTSVSAQAATPAISASSVSTPATKGADLVLNSSQAGSLNGKIAAGQPQSGGLDYDLLAKSMSKQPAPVMVYSEFKTFEGKVTNFDEQTKI